MDAGVRRRLVYTNLLNGISVEQVMDALHLSEREVLEAFRFVAVKIRSYKFERQLPPVPGETIDIARANRLDLLLTLSKLNTATDPTFANVEILPFEMNGSGGMSLAEQRMLEMRMRAGGR